MNKIRLGILGGGGDSLIGVLHRVASHMFDRYEITGGVFNPDFKENIKLARRTVAKYRESLNFESSSKRKTK